MPGRELYSFIMAPFWLLLHFAIIFASLFQFIFPVLMSKRTHKHMIHDFPFTTHKDGPWDSCPYDESFVSTIMITKY